MTRTIFLSLVTASCVVLSASVSAQSRAGGGSSTDDGRMTHDTAQVKQPGAAGAADRQPKARVPSLRKAAGSTADRQGPQGFSVVLVLGDLQGDATSDNVPAAARKALADMKDFLPYKSYRLLDVQWTLCCSRTSSRSVVSRLRGPEGQDYELSLSTNLDPPDRLGVRFLLRAPSGELARSGAPSEVVAQLQRETVRLEQQLRAAAKKTQARSEIGGRGPVEEDRSIQDLRSKLAEMKIRLAEARNDRRAAPAAQARSLKVSSNRAVIDTSFTMDVGETVVVGTSRVAGGDKALIALLTAVSQKPSSR